MLYKALKFAEEENYSHVCLTNLKQFFKKKVIIMSHYKPSNTSPLKRVDIFPVVSYLLYILKVIKSFFTTQKMCPHSHDNQYTTPKMALLNKDFIRLSHSVD